MRAGGNPTPARISHYFYTRKYRRPRNRPAPNPGQGPANWSNFNGLPVAYDVARRVGARRPRRSAALRNHRRFAAAAATGSGNCQADQRLGGAVQRVEMAAGIDQPVELRLADREAGRNRADAARLLREIPDELAPGAFARVAPPVFREDRDARSEQRAAN